MPIIQSILQDESIAKPLRVSQCLSLMDHHDIDDLVDFITTKHHTDKGLWELVEACHTILGNESSAKWARSWVDGSIDSGYDLAFSTFERFMKPFDQATQAELRALWEAQHATPEIVPAKPLKSLYEAMGHYVWYANPFDKEVQKLSIFSPEYIMDTRVMGGLLFPPTPEGKLGAELRSKRGIIPHPGMDWREDVKKLAEWNETIDHILAGNVGMSIESFLNKYS